jgi:hypothetical protein
MQINSPKDLRVYQAAYELAMRVFELSKRFPSEGKFALYEAHFVSKLTDCEGENGETDSSLDFAKDCRYITSEEHAELAALCQEIGRMLGSMIKNPVGFLSH